MSHQVMSEITPSSRSFMVVIVDLDHARQRLPRFATFPTWASIVAHFARASNLNPQSMGKVPVEGQCVR